MADAVQPAVGASSTHFTNVGNGQSLPLTSPDGTYVTTLTVSGSGCPNESWDAWSTG